MYGDAVGKASFTLNIDPPGAPATRCGRVRFQAQYVRCRRKHGERFGCDRLAYEGQAPAFRKCDCPVLARLGVQHEDVKLKAQGEDFAIRKQELLNAEKLRIRFHVCAVRRSVSSWPWLRRDIVQSAFGSLSAPHVTSPQITPVCRPKPPLQESKS